jgi:imidazolonepropionase-like amidohydrolase
MLIIKNARIIPMDRTGIVENGFLFAEEGLILRIGDMKDFDKIQISENSTVIDGKGGWLLPAFIDAHSHLGLFNDSLDSEGSDGNEMTDPITPQMRAIDGIHNADVCFKEAYEGGVGIVMTGPGSGNVLGGQFAIVKTYERTVEKALIRAPGAQKAAFGENPKRVYGKDNKTPQTRMGTASLLREALLNAIDYREKLERYHEKKDEYDKELLSQDKDKPDYPEKPDPDLQAESLLPVIDGTLPLKIHAHRQDDLLTAVRICNEFGLTYTLEHCTEGHLIADILFEEYVAGQTEGRGTGVKGTGGKLLGVVVGPIIGDRSKPELSNLTLRTASVLRAAGLPVAIMTDHPCVPQQYLSLSAALAVRGGMSEKDAFEAITIIPAEMLGISDSFGSLTKGKSADFSLFDGDPFDYRSKLMLFTGSGAIRFDPTGLAQAGTKL